MNNKTNELQIAKQIAIASKCASNTESVLAASKDETHIGGLFKMATVLGFIGAISYAGICILNLI